MLEFYVNVVLAVVGTGWVLVWLGQAIGSALRDRRYAHETALREMVSGHCQGRAEAVTAELRALEAYLGVRYEYNKELKGYWFEPLPPRASYKAK